MAAPPSSIFAGGSAWDLAARRPDTIHVQQGLGGQSRCVHERGAGRHLTGSVRYHGTVWNKADNDSLVKCFADKAIIFKLTL